LFDQARLVVVNHTITPRWNPTTVSAAQSWGMRPRRFHLPVSLAACAQPAAACSRIVTLEGVARHHESSLARRLHRRVAGRRPAVRAAGFLLFQHGGRATASRLHGARRRSSAMHYNPAAIARLSGLQIQGGLDFSIADDTFGLDGETFSAQHDINFPPAAYLSWKPGDSALGLGIGIDSPMWHTEDWLPALFPRAAETRRFEVRLLQVHPVVAWRIGERWSFGVGALRLGASCRKATVSR
jgi:hypothetical protein